MAAMVSGGQNRCSAKFNIARASAWHVIKLTGWKPGAGDQNLLSPRIFLWSKLLTLAFLSAAFRAEQRWEYGGNQGAHMGRGLLLWLIGIPLPIILLIWLFGGLH
jgi:hypothetical protein